VESVGRGRQMGMLETDSHKFGSDCPGSLRFVEELFCLMTLQAYPCNSDRISDMKKTLERN